jgi:hypothetical protein
MNNLKLGNSNLKMTTTTSIRWRSIAPTLLVIWIVGMIDKIGVAVIATHKSFLAELHLLGKRKIVPT